MSWRDTDDSTERQAKIRLAFGTDPMAYGAEVLGLLADGPILDATRAFCPAGRLTWAQVRARERAGLR